jgi:aminomethyltransferase
MSATLKRTPLYDIHVELGARMVEFAGFEMPIQYAGLKAEHLAVRDSAGIFDVSHMGELRIRGTSAVARVNRLITNDLSALSNGKALYTFCCNESGSILDDLIVYRLADDEVYVVCNASNRAKIAAHFSKELSSSDVSFEDESDKTALLAVQGPRAVAEVESISDTQLTDMVGFSAKQANVGGVQCLAARTGYTGEDGVELFCAWEQAPQLFRSLLAKATPIGLGARDTLRLEARLLLYGNDMDESCNPFETGFGWVVKFDKRDGTDFIGRTSLQKVQATGVKRRLVGFEMRGRGIARATYPLLPPFASDSSTPAPIGHCTSGSPSPTLGTSIGLGYVPIAFAMPGQKLNVDCRGKCIEAEVVRTPFYRRPSP